MDLAPLLASAVCTLCCADIQATSRRLGMQQDTVVPSTAAKRVLDTSIESTESHISSSARPQLVSSSSLWMKPPSRWRPSLQARSSMKGVAQLETTPICARLTRPMTSVMSTKLSDTSRRRKKSS